jgi:hypothetical protein
MRRGKGILADARNLTMRMSMRRFARPIDAFSKRVETTPTRWRSYFVFYNFVRIHRTLRTSPAMTTGPIGYGHGRRVVSIGRLISAMRCAPGHSGSDESGPPNTGLLLVGVVIFLASIIGGFFR